MVSETHLTADISDAAMRIPGFTLIRNDSGSTRTHGVCAYIADHLHFDKVDDSCRNVLSFRLTKFNTYIFVVYRPPSYSIADNDALSAFLLHSCIDKEAVVMGDFNLPSLDWSYPEKVSSAASASDARFLDLFDSVGLTQWITEPTFPRSGNILDIILTNESDRIGDVFVNPPPPGCDHCSIHCSYIFDIDLQQPISSAHRLLWHRGKYEKLNSFLTEIDWDQEFQFLTAEEAFKQLATTLQSLIPHCIPSTKQGQPSNKLPWKRNPPTSLKHRRSSTWSAYKQARATFGRKAPVTQSRERAFLQVNNQLRSFAISSQIDYEKSLLFRLKESPKLLHSYLRHKKQYRPSVGPLTLSTGRTTDDPRTMANSFAETFASVFATTVPPDPAPHQGCNAELDNITFTLKDVEDVLSHLDANSAMGPDGLHPHLLKACA